MKLFTKEIDKQLFAQYPKGSDLDNQMVVAKIFNPYGRGVWYLLNSDPQDPDYIWAIVDLFEPEMGSVSRLELQTIKVPPFGLGLERDIYFSPKPAKEVWQGIMRGERFAHGGMTPGRWYQDNTGKELRFVGESDGKLLFNDGEKVVYKSEEDFEVMPKERKLFGFFEHGGEMDSDGEVLMEIDTHKAIKDGDKIIIYRKELEFDSNYDVIGEKLRFLYTIPIENEDDLLPIFEEFEETNRYLIDEANREMQGYKKGGYMAKGGELTPYIVWVSKDGEKRELYGEYKSKRAADMKMNKLWQTGEYKGMGNKPKSMYEKEGFYAMGGKVKFSDKVKAIQKTLLKRKKVSPKVQKDYGKTYDKKEALDSAKRIAGSLRAKYELKKK